MGLAYSYNEDDFHLRLVQGIQDNIICNVEQIFSAIKQFKDEIEQKVEVLEKQEESLENDKAIAVLLRQEQYLDALARLPKYELSEMFLEIKLEGNSNVLRWYNKD